MKIKRFVAKDIRTALTQIKEQLGADAVIMSNKKTAEGVELMAAVDYSQSTDLPQSPTSTAPDQVSSQEKQLPAASTAQNGPAVSTANRMLSQDVVNIGQSSPVLSNDNRAVNQASNPLNVNDTNAPVDSLHALLNRQAQQQVNNSPNVPQQSKPQSDISPAFNNNDSIEQQLKSFTERLQQSSADLQDSSSESITSSLNIQNVVPNIVPTRSQDSLAANTDTRVLKEPAKNTAVVNKKPDDITGNITANTSTDTATNNLTNKKTSSDGVTEQDFASMQKEMSTIRSLLEHQVSGLMWQDLAKKDPQRAALVSRLINLGLNENIADQIAGYVPQQMHEKDAWSQATKLIAQQINTTKNDIINRGGVVALVGPTGVGKTTTIAKLAAGFAQVHGANQVALISTDTFRIAGFEQLETYGKIIGCQVVLAKNSEALNTFIDQFTHKKLILIDTAGMGQRDVRLAEQLTALVANSRVRIRNYLVLAANSQQRVMQENVDRFKKIPLSGCIYTKIDESFSIGEIITTSIQNGLSIGYLTDGQRVPEDIRVANAEKLVSLADKMASKLVNRHVGSHMNSLLPMPMVLGAVL